MASSPYLFYFFSKSLFSPFAFRCTSISMNRNHFYIYDSQKVGFISLALGIFISILFGFIFGLILGTTEMPWGFGDFPTEEMKGRYENH